MRVGHVSQAIFLVLALMASLALSHSHARGDASKPQCYLVGETCQEQHGPYQYDDAGVLVVGFVLGNIPKSQSEKVKFTECDRKKTITVSFNALKRVETRCTPKRPHGGVWIVQGNMLVPEGVPAEKLISLGISPSGISKSVLPTSFQALVASKRSGAVAAYSFSSPGAGLTLEAVTARPGPAN